MARDQGERPGRVARSVRVRLAERAIDRLAWRVAGPSGPRIAWTSALFLAPVVVFSVYASFWNAMHQATWLRFGNVTFGVNNGLAVLLLPESVVGALVAWASGHLSASSRDGIARNLLRFALGVTVLFVAVAFMRVLQRPDPARWEDKLVTLGWIERAPELAPPAQGSVDRPLTDRERYPIALFGAVKEYRWARYCSSTACNVYFTASDEEFPSTFEYERIPKSSVSTYAFMGEPLLFRRDAAHHILVLRTGDSGFSEYFAEDASSASTIPGDIARYLCAPLLSIIAAALGLVLGLAARRRRGALEASVHPARIPHRGEGERRRHGELR